MTTLPSFLQGVRPMSYNTTAEANKPLFSPSPTEQKIKAIATEKTTQESTKLTSQDLFGDAKKIQEAKVLGSEEALLNTMKYYKQKGLVVEGIDLDSEIQALSPKQEESSNTTIGERLQESGEKRLQQAKEIEESDRGGFRKLLDKTALKAGSFSDIIGAGVGEAFETSGQLLSAITPDSIEDRIKNRVIEEFQMVAGSDVGQTIGTIGKGLGYTAKEVFDVLPENTQKDLESLGTVGVGILDAVGAGALGKAVAKGTPGAVSSIKEGVGKKTFLTQAKRDAYIAKQQENIDKIVGQASQPGKKQLGDTKAFESVLKEVDTTDVKTYNDLSERMSDKITAIVSKQDEILPSDKVYDISSLSTKSKGGTIEVNFIETALDDMEKLYEKIGEIDNLERIRQLRAGKLSVKDINDIAREYNVNFGKKAFNKDGSAKFSDLGQSFENTRKGVKEQSRQLLPDDTMKSLDSELSDLYTARGLSDDMADKVSVLKNRLDERGIIANLSNKAGKIMDILTLGAPKELFSAMLLKGGMGKATLDSLTLQSRLAKNIKAIESAAAKIEKAQDARVISEILEDLAKSIGLTREAINEQALKGKEALGGLADDIADKTGARAKFMDDGGKSLDDFNKVGTTESAKIDKDFTRNVLSGNYDDILEDLLKDKSISNIKKGRVRERIEDIEISQVENIDSVTGFNVVLQSEAKKSNTYKDFIDSLEKKGKVFYHGTDKTFDKFKQSTVKGRFREQQIPGIYITNNNKVSSIFSERALGGNPRIMKVVATPERPYIVKNRKSFWNSLGLSGESEINNVKARKILENRGYDSIVFKRGLKTNKGTADEIILFNENHIKTESQLKEIYNQANK